MGIPNADNMRSLSNMMTPLKRVGTAEEAASALFFLACPWSSYVTGQVLEVNGGQFM